MGCGASTMASTGAVGTPHGAPQELTPIQLTGGTGVRAKALGDGEAVRRERQKARETDRNRQRETQQDTSMTGEAGPGGVGAEATNPMAEVVGAISTASTASDVSSCGSDVAQFSDTHSSVHSELADDEIDGLGRLDENQKTVVHWLRNLGMLQYWPQFFEHELCDMVGARSALLACRSPARLTVHRARAGGGLACHGGGAA